MAGLTKEGLTIETLPQVVETLKEKAVEIWQDLTPEGEVVNVEVDSAIGRQIGVVSPSIADLWEAVQEVYDAFNPNAAEGIALDNIVALGGVTRLQQSATRATLLVTGNTGILIPAGSKVSSSTTGKLYSSTQVTSLLKTSCTGVGVDFTSIADSTVYTVSFRIANAVTFTNISVTTPASGTTLLSLQDQFATLVSGSFPDLTTFVENSRLYIRAVDPFQQFEYSSSANVNIVKVIKPLIFEGDEFGEIEQPANTIDTIATPVFGWDSAVNPTSATTGRFTETDAELRERFRNSKFEKATNVIESLYSSILSIDGVEDIRIYENDTDVVDGNGVNGHSFLTIVEGGLGTEIAQAIWDNKPVGILSQGNTTVTVFDTMDLPHDISFSRPVAVNIYVSIDITTDSNYPQDGDQKIKDAIIAFIDQLKIGDDVTYSRLYTPINSVPGHQVESLYIGTSPSPVGTSNIVINFDEIANIESSFIEIT